MFIVITDAIVVLRFAFVCIIFGVFVISSVVDVIAAVISLGLLKTRE